MFTTPATGLRTILRTFPAVTDIFVANDFESGYDLAANKRPSAIIIDGNEHLENDCHQLKQLLSRFELGRCVAIANTMKQAVQAQQVGADAVLLQGFSTSTLYQTLISLSVIPETGNINEETSSSQQTATAVPLSQRN